MRRILVLLTVAVVMAAMMLTMAMPAFAGNAYARGQNDTNRGFFQNQPTGDAANEVCDQNGSNCGTPRTNWKGQDHGVWNN
jgi:hypothetical protein